MSDDRPMPHLADEARAIYFCPVGDGDEYAEYAGALSTLRAEAVTLLVQAREQRRRILTDLWNLNARLESLARADEMAARAERACLPIESESRRSARGA